jgi:hypothetical protein
MTIDAAARYWLDRVGRAVVLGNCRVRRAHRPHRSLLWMVAAPIAVLVWGPAAAVVGLKFTLARYNSRRPVLGASQPHRFLASLAMVQAYRQHPNKLAMLSRVLRLMRKGMEVLPYGFGDHLKDI